MRRQVVIRSIKSEPPELSTETVDRSESQERVTGASHRSESQERTLCRFRYLQEFWMCIRQLFFLWRTRFSPRHQNEIV